MDGERRHDEGDAREQDQGLLEGLMVLPLGLFFQPAGQLGGLGREHLVRELGGEAGVGGRSLAVGAPPKVARPTILTSTRSGDRTTVVSPTASSPSSAAALSMTTSPGAAGARPSARS